MTFVSTRGGPGVSAAQAFLDGVAPDGGLYVPETLPTLDLTALASPTHSCFANVLATVMRAFLPTWSDEDLARVIGDRYDEETFGPNPAPLVQLNPYVERDHLLALDMGPSGSYKDYAMRIVPAMIDVAKTKVDDAPSMWLMLVATSGNAGAAALDSLLNVGDAALMVFYPKGALTDLQVAQLAAHTQGHSYIAQSALSFDALQAELRDTLTDASLRATLRRHDVGVTTLNSLNIARLIPQVAVYVHAYGQLVRQDKVMPNETINICLPGGNFGNAMAAWYAAEMGLPIGNILVATGDHRALSDVIRLGKVKPRRKMGSSATPGFDVAAPAHIERLLHAVATPATRYAASFASGQAFTVEGDDLSAMQRRFIVGRSDEARTLRTICRVYDETDYLVDPHTAAAFDVYDRHLKRTGDTTKTIIVSVASPLRYARTVGRALFGDRVAHRLSERALTERLAVEAGLDDELKKYEGGDPGAIPELTSGTMRRTILEQLGVYDAT